MEINDILNLVGIEPTEDMTIDMVKKQLDAKYLDKSTAHEHPDIQSKIIGKHFNALRQGMIKSFGVEEDFIKEGDKYLEPADAFLKIAEKVNNDIVTIQKQANEGTDKRIIDLQNKLEEKDKSIKSFTTMNKDLNTKLEESQNQFTSELTRFKVNSKLSDLSRGLRIVDDLLPATKRGIDAELQEDYKWNLDDNGDLQVRDKNGDIVPSTQKASTPANPLEVISGIYEKNNALIKNGAVKKEETQRFQTQQTGGNTIIAKRRPVNQG